MKETSKTKGSIRMAGETMEVYADAAYLAQCKSGVASRLPSIVTRLCKTLVMRGVARFFINGIRIGETVALVDRKAGYTFRLRIEVHSIRVLGIYENLSPQRDAAQVLYLVNTSLLRAVSGRLVAA